MADQADTAAVTDAVAKLILDEETGEMVSKSELKKRQKKRLNDQKKVISIRRTVEGILD